MKRSISICQRTILFHVLLFALAVPGKSQFSAGGGLGIMDTSGACVQLKVQHEFKYVGFTGGFISSMPGKLAGTNFNLEMFAPIRLSDSRRFVPHAGYVYKLVSNDQKYLNGARWIAGLSAEFGVLNQGVVYMDASVISKRAFIFLIGFRGIFGEYKGCE